jgi:hypothetical protein
MPVNALGKGKICVAKGDVPGCVVRRDDRSRARAVPCLDLLLTSLRYGGSEEIAALTRLPTRRKQSCARAQGSPILLP